MISRGNVSIKSSALILMLILPACGSQRASEEAQRSNALYAERCKTEAGMKIYKQVKNVDGIFLEKIRPHQSDREWNDRFYPGAAFAAEVRGDEYIESFLGYEHSNPSWGAITAERRGFVTKDFQPNNPYNLPGYRFVQATQGGVLYEYFLRTESIPESKIGASRVILQKRKAAVKVRYAVTYEDHVVPEERILGIASSTVKVVDTYTGALLGEYTRYSKASSFTKIGGQNWSPWLSSYSCGNLIHADGNKSTRQFVDQVLIPVGQ